jgi:hypothetical protein
VLSHLKIKFHSVKFTIGVGTALAPALTRFTSSGSRIDAIVDQLLILFTCFLNLGADIIRVFSGTVILRAFILLIWSINSCCYLAKIRLGRKTSLVES